MSIFNKEDNYFVREYRSSNGTCTKYPTKWYSNYYIQRELDNKVLITLDGVWGNFNPNCVLFPTKKSAQKFLKLSLYGR